MSYILNLCIEHTIEKNHKNNYIIRMTNKFETLTMCQEMFQVLYVTSFPLYNNPTS